MRSKSTCISQEDFPTNEKWTRCKYLNEKWYWVLHIRVNMPCLIAEFTLLKRNFIDEDS